MIGFLYTSNYEAPIKPLAIELHSAMYAMSIKFEMPGLQSLSKARFEEDLSASATTLKRLNLVELIPDVYNSTVESDQGLREPLVRCIGDNIQAFLANPYFQDAHKANPDFAFDLLRYQAKNGIVPPSEPVGRCRICVAAKSKMAAEGSQVSYNERYTELLIDHANDSKEFQQLMARSKPPTVAFLDHLRKITEISRR
jgi:hypothetical protein